MRPHRYAQAKGAALAEYSIIAGLVAVITITAVLFLGDNTRLPLCISEAELAQRAQGETRAPCEARVAIEEPDPSPGPTFETFAVTSELPGFFNPTGPAMAVEAVAFGAPIVGQPTQQQIFNALCVALGHLGPASNVSTTDVATGNAFFLTGGRWIWDDLSETWSYDAGLAPYGIMDGAVPIVDAISCRRIIP